MIGLGAAVGSAGCTIVGAVGGWGSPADAVGVFLLFFLMIGSCVRSLALFWTRVMMSDAGKIWASG